MMAAQSEFSLQVVNTQEDYQRFQSFYCSRQLWSFKRFGSAIGYQLLLVFTLIPLVAALLAVVQRVTGSTIPAAGVIVPVLGAGLALLIYFKTANRLLGRFWKLDLSNFSRPTSFSFSDEGIRSSSETGESLLKWPAIRDIVTSPHAVYLGLGGGTAIVIPTRFFKSSDEAAAFIAFARERTTTDGSIAKIFE
jgi:hypothetical protein